MKHSIFSLLFITLSFGNSIIHADYPMTSTPETGIKQEIIEPTNDQPTLEFKNKEVHNNRLAQENTIFELEELLKKIHEDIYIGIPHINRDDKDEILSILKQRKKEIKNQLDELKKFLPYYNEEKYQGLSQNTKFLIAASALVSGGLLIFALNYNEKSTS